MENGFTEKKILPVTLIVCLAVFVLFLLKVQPWKIIPLNRPVKVGFVYDNDESTPYTYNFIQAEDALENMLQDQVETMVYSNVPENEIETPMRKLAESGCDIIFTNGYGDIASVAAEYPQIQFCQVSNETWADGEELPNYHTFKGESYQGRYVSGVAAGLKLQEMIEKGELSRDEVKIGFVAAFPNTEVISGYTAFLLGVRSVVPEAVMSVRYINTWSNYTLEKACAEELLKEGCVAISQHTDTIGPAIACEEFPDRKVFHVGYNQNMLDVAPTTSLVSTRINWTPYVLESVQAIREGRNIEDVVKGRVHGNDTCAGFDYDWIQVLELNDLLAAEGTQEKIDDLLKEIRSGKYVVFKGDYIGVNPKDESDTIDLREGFIENAESSVPTFHYILEDVIDTGVFKPKY